MAIHCYFCRNFRRKKEIVIWPDKSWYCFHEHSESAGLNGTCKFFEEMEEK